MKKKKLQRKYKKLKAEVKELRKYKLLVEKLDPDNYILGRVVRRHDLGKMPFPIKNTILTANYRNGEFVEINHEWEKFHPSIESSEVKKGIIPLNKILSENSEDYFGSFDKHIKYSKADADMMQMFYENSESDNKVSEENYPTEDELVALESFQKSSLEKTVDKHVSENMSFIDHICTMLGIENIDDLPENEYSTDKWNTLIAERSEAVSLILEKLKELKETVDPNNESIKLSEILEKINDIISDTDSSDVNHLNSELRESTWKEVDKEIENLFKFDLSKMEDEILENNVKRNEIDELPEEIEFEYNYVDDKTDEFVADEFHVMISEAAGRICKEENPLYGISYNEKSEEESLNNFDLSKMEDEILENNFKETIEYASNKTPADCYTEVLEHGPSQMFPTIFRSSPNENNENDIMYVTDIPSKVKKSLKELENISNEIDKVVEDVNTTIENSFSKTDSSQSEIRRYNFDSLTHNSEIKEFLEKLDFYKNLKNELIARNLDPETQFEGISIKNNIIGAHCPKLYISFAIDEDYNMKCVAIFNYTVDNDNFQAITDDDTDKDENKSENNEMKKQFTSNSIFRCDDYYIDIQRLKSFDSESKIILNDRNHLIFDMKKTKFGTYVFIFNDYTTEEIPPFFKDKPLISDDKVFIMSNVDYMLIDLRNVEDIPEIWKEFLNEIDFFNTVDAIIQLHKYDPSLLYLLTISCGKLTLQSFNNSTTINLVIESGKVALSTNLYD